MIVDETVKSLDQLKDRYVPESRPSYSPVSHYDYMYELNNHLQSQGCEILNERYTLIADKLQKDDKEKTPGMVMFAKIGIAYRDHQNERFTYNFGAINSHNTKHAIKLFAGAEFGLCSNGMIWGAEYTTNQRHQGANIIQSVRSMIESGYSHVQLQHKKMDDAVAVMEKIGIGRDRAAELVMDAMKSKAIAPSAIEPVWDHWEQRTPEGELFPERNMWSLYNAFTEKFKDERINNVYTKNRKLNNFITNTPEYMEEYYGS